MPKDDLIEKELSTLSDETLHHIAFSTTWQSDVVANQVDADGYSASSSQLKEDINLNRSALQHACWEMFFSNPQVNTSVRGLIGRIVGNGFEVTSDVQKIQDVLHDTIFDPRNRLYALLPKYVMRNYLEGETFLILTLHADGFVEIDFVDPANVNGGMQSNEGIVYHPNKAWMPLAFNVTSDSGEVQAQVPSINLAYFPDLIDLFTKKMGEAYSADKFATCMSNDPVFKPLGGLCRFMIYWDRGLLTTCSTGHLRTTLKWLNRYEMLKEYEIDHKRSSGAYLWAFEFEDIKSFKTWLSLSDTQRRETGIMAKKTPGGTLMVPPGMKMTVHSPQLPKISDADTDILHMITAGLNEPEDVSTGQAKGTYASVKASRGPMSDRVADEVELFKHFFIQDFWRPIFHLKNMVGKFPTTFSVREAVDFKDKEPVFKTVKRTPEQLIELSFPTSEVVDYEGRARSFLGVKHGSTNSTLGLPNSHIAKKLGVSNYRKARLDKATEDDRFPELLTPEDDEASQEGIAESPVKKPLVKRKLVKKEN